MCDDIWGDVMFSFDNISDCVECFNEMVLGLLDILAPLKTLRVCHQSFPWLCSAFLTQARRLCDIAHRRALKSRSHSNWSLYRSHRNKVNSVLRSAKAKYFENLSSMLIVVALRDFGVVSNVSLGVLDLLNYPVISHCRRI